MKRRERRRAVRVAKPLDIEYSANCPPIRARVADLSETGAFVDTSEPVLAGSVVKFRLFLNDAIRWRPVLGKARVAWSQPRVGMALEFQGLSREDRDRIKYYVAAIFFGHEEGT